jgi:hypothetical protein
MLKENFRPLYGHPSIHPSIHHTGWIITIGFCWLSPTPTLYLVGTEERLQNNVVFIWSHILKKILKCYLSTTTRRTQLTSIFFNKMEECCVELSLPPCYLLERKKHVLTLLANLLYFFLFFLFPFQLIFDSLFLSLCLICFNPILKHQCCLLC